jgi:NADH:ubiquinone oxidoreductase subunit 2 (subunit N)
MLALQNPTYSPIAVGGLFIAFTLGMFITAVTALSQINQVLRFFGYSSVINISLIVFIVMTSEFNDLIIGLAIGQLLMYIVNTTAICLLIGDLFKTSRKNIGVEQFRNLSRVDAVTCTVLVFILVSTGGLPITGGFFTSN